MLTKLLNRIRSGPVTLRIEGIDRDLPVNPGQTVLDAALSAGVPFPHKCRSGACGTCRCRLTAGSVRERVDTSYVLDGEALRAGTILACQSLPRSSVSVAVDGLDTADLPAVQSTDASVADVEPLARDVVQLTLELDQPLRYRAGQSAELALPDLETPRQYSFARGADGEAVRQAQFCVRRVPGGEMSNRLHAVARPGHRLRVRGPFGDFWLREEPGPLLFVAGSSGLAPIHAMLEDASPAARRRPAGVYFGVRTREDLFWLDRLEHLRRSWEARFDLVTVLSGEPSDSDWDGRRGTVVDALEADVSAHPVDAYTAYLCGPPPMVYAGIERLRRLGVPDGRIHYDAFLDARQTVRTTPVTDRGA